MTHRKRHSTKKMEDYINEKIEVAHELGIHGSSDVEVNTKIASAGESKYSNKSMVTRHNHHNDQKTAKER